MSDENDSIPVLMKFARDCALDVIDWWDAPDVVRRYLETGEEALREAAKSAVCSALREIRSSQTDPWTAQIARAESAAECAYLTTLVVAGTPQANMLPDFCPWDANWAATTIAQRACWAHAWDATANAPPGAPSDTWATAWRSARTKQEKQLHLALTDEDQVDG